MGKPNILKLKILDNQKAIKDLSGLDRILFLAKSKKRAERVALRQLKSADSFLVSSFQKQVFDFEIKKPLTLHVKGFIIAVWTGLEPATPCVTGRYSNQLNYQTVLRAVQIYIA